MKNVLKMLLAGTAGLGFLCAIAMAQEEMTAEEEIAAFVLSNATYVLYHEMGHLFVGEFGIPVLGKEEDAADSIAALLLLNEETEEADNALIDAADGWFLSHDASAETSDTFEDAEFYDEHSLDLQRAYAIVCLMVGSNAEVFGEVATAVGIDEERQESCAFDFAQAAQSWGTVLEPLELAEGATAADIYVVYEETTDYAGYAEFLAEARFLETAAEKVLVGFALPRQIQLKTAECGEPNAFYDPENGEITFCYELAAYFEELIVKALDAENADGQNG